MRTADLTLDEKIGQMLMCGWQGSAEGENRSVSAHALALLDDLCVGGVILMGRNVGPAAETAALCNALQERARLPLLVATDQEGGLVCRFTEPGLTFPGGMALGAAGSEALAEQVAAAISTQLRAMGVHVDFAPVLDVNNNAANPVIGIRAFSECPDEVTRLGLAALRGFARGGVLAAAKHFPGHGDTAVDSHHALPVQPADRARLDAVELVPFRAAIAAGVPMVMTSHIVFPAFDADRPATLSRAILTDLLRHEMGFDGLIVTDCMEMSAITDRYGAGESAVLAVEAGVDLVLICHTERAQRAARDALRDAVTSGRVPEARLDESLARILAAKQALGILESPRVEPARADAVVSALEYRVLEAEAARAGIVVLDVEQDVSLPGADPRQAHILPHSLLPLAPDESVSLLGDQRLATALAGALAARGVRTQFEPPGNGSDPGLCIVLADGAAGAALAEQTAGWHHERWITVAFRDPYTLARFPTAPLACAVFGARPCQIEAFVDALLGRFVPTGRMPVTLDTGVRAFSHSGVQVPGVNPQLSPVVDR
jgi:beta-N-acetylhexosaminidase